MVQYVRSFVYARFLVVHALIASRKPIVYGVIVVRRNDTRFGEIRLQPVDHTNNHHGVTRLTEILVARLGIHKRMRIDRILRIFAVTTVCRNVAVSLQKFVNCLGVEQ